MNTKYDLPETIKTLLKEETYSIDKIGMSKSNILLFQDKVLKIQDINEESENEYNVMKWLNGKLPVPKVLEFKKKGKKSYLLMTKVYGEMSCAETYMKKPELLTTILVKALKMLWEVDISNCPYSCNLEKKLQMASYIIDHNLVDINNVEPDTFGDGRFKDPKELFNWLNLNKPEEELVLSHGDFCLPNIFLSGERVSGFLDLGKTGIADKWQDIALCYRSLLHNFDGRYTGKSYKGFTADMLFEKLEIEPNWDKINYYILLDELF